MLQSLVDILAGQSLAFGCLFVFGVLLLCGFGLPMPEDVVLVTGGILTWLASHGDDVTFASMVRDRNLLSMVAVGLAGIVAGDSVIYCAGRRYGARLAEFRLLRRVVTPEKLEKVEKLMRRRGNLVVVVARYLPGLRAPTYFTAGHARLPFWEFVLFDFAAALVSAPLWVCLGYYFGHNVEAAARAAAKCSHYLLGAALVVVALLAVRWWQRRAGAGEPGLVGPPEVER
jgi:membrane protein DedA with SNARE-associated domain